MLASLLYAVLNTISVILPRCLFTLILSASKNSIIGNWLISVSMLILKAPSPVYKVLLIAVFTSVSNTFSFAISRHNVLSASLVNCTSCISSATMPDNIFTIVLGNPVCIFLISIPCVGTLPQKPYWLSSNCLYN